MKKIFLILILGTFLCASTSYALPTVPWDIGEVNLASDNSAEYLINANGDLSNGDSNLDIGDRLRGMYKITTVGAIGSEESIGGSDWEFTGIFDVEVIAKDNQSTDGSGNRIFDYTFGPTNSFEAIYGTGAMTAMYLDDTFVDYQRASTTDSAENLIATATNTDHYWTFGFTGTEGVSQGGEGWIALQSPEDVSVFQNFSTGQGVGGGAFMGLNLINNPLGPPLAPLTQAFNTVKTGDGSPVDLIGSGTLQGINDQGTILQPFDIYDEFEFNIKPVPEPTTMLLFGTGLLGLAFLGRKKMNKS